MLHYSDYVRLTPVLFFLESIASAGTEIKPEIEIFRRTSTYAQKVRI